MHQGSSPMFAVFMIAMMSMTLIPYTIYWLFFYKPKVVGASEVKLWSTVSIFPCLGAFD